MYFTISANAGLVTNTPITTPAIVVSANPTNFPNPNPKRIIGNIVAKVVVAVAKIIKNALF